MRLLVATLFFATLAQAQDKTLPENATALYSVIGRGVQIYECTRQGDLLQWLFKAPEATLFSSEGAVVGRHSAGPLWTWSDGSAVKGKLVASQPAPLPGNIPWLLLATSPASDITGALSSITWIRRSATQGGVASAGGCDAGHEHATSRVSYTATYTLYTSPPQL